MGPLLALNDYLITAIYTYFLYPGIKHPNDWHFLIIRHNNETLNVSAAEIKEALEIYG